MPQLDISTFPSQIFWLVITFIAMFLIMWRISVPKIADALEARQKRISDNLGRAEDIKKEAEAAIEAYEAALAEARAEAQTAVAEASAALLEEQHAREAELAETLKKRVAIAAPERLAGEAPGGDDATRAVDAVIKARG